MKRDIINSVVESYKKFRDTGENEYLVELIEGYSELGLYEELSNFLREYFEKGGEVDNLLDISDILPEEISKVLVSEDVEVDEDFDADSFLEMGELLWEIGSPEEAKDNYKKAFEYYSAMGKDDSAGEVLSTLKERYPNDEDIEELEIKDRKEEVISRLDELQEKKNKDEKKIRYNLGKKFHEEDLYEEAENNYRKILDLDSSHRARRLLVSLLKETGDFEDALSTAQNLSGSEKLEALYEIGQDLESSGEEDFAEEVFEEIYSLDPDYKDVSKRVKVEEEPRELMEEIEEEIEVEKEEVTEKVERKEKKKESQNIVFL